MFKNNDGADISHTLRNPESFGIAERERQIYFFQSHTLGN